MSDDTLKAFLEEVMKDPKLLVQLKDPNTDPLALAESLGFVLSQDDWLAYQHGQPTLSDQDLEAVAGGTSPTIYETQCAPQCTPSNVIGCMTQVLKCQTRKGWTCP